jgi:hemoglobin-like flavoprotein
MMTDEEIQYVKKTWKIFRAIDPSLVGDTFYSKLFMDNPRLRAMFPKQMDKQYIKLIDMLSIIVSRLDRLEELTDDIALMARRHVSYGVRPDHYKMVGSALLWTLQHGLGTDWTPEVKNAWIKCYTILSDTMINASSGHTAG